MVVTPLRRSVSALSLVSFLPSDDCPSVTDPVTRSPAGACGRDGDVLGLVVRGHSNREAARGLGRSEWIVQDHLKALFAKFDVSRRSQLVAMLFFDHHAPLHVADAPTAGTQG
jgi:DNA-binding NarL/FixJ family response regulator